MVDCPLCSRSLVIANRQGFGIQSADRLVVLSQLDELLGAMDLPEASVENQHHVFPSGVGFQTRRAIQTAGRGELIRSFGNYAVNRQILARRRIFSRRTGPGADGQRQRGKKNEKD